MGAKDTVMSPEELRKTINAPLSYLVPKDEWDILMTVAQAQAEISFKAGKQEALSTVNTQLEAALEEGKRRGIREVVEWIIEHNG